MMNSKVEDMATKVANDMVKAGADKEEVFNPMIFMVIIDILNAFIESCGKNNPPEKIQKLSARPKWYHKWAVKRMVRRELGSRRAYRAYGYKVTEALLKTGREITLQDIQELIDEYDD